MPVYKVDQIWLEKAINSVINQLYENWELCIVDDASNKSYIYDILTKYSEKDSRIKVSFLKVKQGISGASNVALNMATGDFIGLLDNDDELSINALYENVKLLNAYPDTEMIYSDEDKFDITGKRCDPFFKPDWSPDMFLSCMFTCHFGVYRKRIVDEIGGFRIGYEGIQDYDFVLRFTERTNKILHVSKILYHWRKIPGSLALDTDTKNYAFDTAKKALSDAMERRDIPSKVCDGKWLGSYRIKYEIFDWPKISILIYIKDQAVLLRKCISSILYNNSYHNYEILIIDNNSIKQETIEYLKTLSKQRKIRVLSYKNDFNTSAINNYGARKSNGDILLFINNVCEIKNKDSIIAMVEHVQRKKIGAVGAKLRFNKNRMQHCGILLRFGANRIPGKYFYKYSEINNGYFGRNDIVHNVSAVSSSAMMVKREVFIEGNGFDERLKLAYNDVDLCLNLREKGYLIIYTPYAEFNCHRYINRVNKNTHGENAMIKKEKEYFRTKWKDILERGDPYYNPNLILM